MSHHHHEHHKSQHQHDNPPNKGRRPNWGLIAAAILILIAMLTYVLTMDESSVPGKTPVVLPANP